MGGGESLGYGRSSSAILGVTILLLTLSAASQPSTAYSVGISGFPDAFHLERESHFTVVIDLEGSESITFDRIIVSIFDIRGELLAAGYFAPDGRVGNAGNFLLSVTITEGEATGNLVVGGEQGIVYQIEVLFSSDDFELTEGNEMRVMLIRGEGMVPLQATVAPFDIGIEPPWGLIFGVAVAVDAGIFVTAYLYLKRRIGMG